MRSIWPIATALALAGSPTPGASAQERARTVLQRHTGAAQAAAPAPSAAELLAAARVVFVTSTSPSYDASELEAELLDQKRFQALGLKVTRDASAADLVVEVTEGDSAVTLKYTIVDVGTRTVVAGGKVTAIFGLVSKITAKEIVGKIDKARRST